MNCITWEPLDMISNWNNLKTDTRKLQPRDLLFTFAKKKIHAQLINVHKSKLDMHKESWTAWEVFI